MQSAGAHFSRDCQHKAQTSQKVKAGLSHDRRVCFRAQHGAAAGHGWRQGKSFRATEEDFRSRHPYQGNRLPVWPPVRRRLLDGGRTTRTWETGKGLGRQAGKNIFRPLEFRWVARLPKKRICEKRHKTDRESYSVPQLSFFAKPPPLPLSGRGAATQLVARVANHAPRHGSPSQQRPRTRCPQGPQTWRFQRSGVAAPRPDIGFFTSQEHSRHHPDAGSQTTAAQAPACFFCEKSLPAKVQPASG